MSLANVLYLKKIRTGDKSTGAVCVYVTEEVNCYLVWTFFDDDYHLMSMHKYNRNEAIEAGVELAKLSLNEIFEKAL